MATWDTASTVAAECWFRNPQSYIRECAELLVRNIAWDRGTLFKYRVDPNRFLELYYPAEIDYRVLAIGEQGAAELRRGHTMRNPVAVYPVWVYGLDSLNVLERMLSEPIGESWERCRKAPGSADERPVYGQENRVVLTRLPKGHTGPGRSIYRLLREVQQEHPEAILHVHGAYAFNVAFGQGLRAGDVDVRFPASKGNVLLPNGRVVPYEEASEHLQWVHLLGVSVSDLAVPRNRCMFNIAAAQWAAQNWDENLRFSTRRLPNGLPKSNKRVYTGKLQVGDRFLCNVCSLQRTCKYFRDRGVCSVPEADTSSLARFFKTRDSDQIIEGLGSLLALQSKRLEAGINEEVSVGVLHPEVTRILNSLFENGVRLAKLVNPVLAAAGAPKIGVQINQAAPATPNALMANIIAEFEQRGIARADITPEMIQAFLTAPKAIDVNVA